MHCLQRECILVYKTSRNGNYVKLTSSQHSDSLYVKYTIWRQNKPRLDEAKTSSKFWNATGVSFQTDSCDE